MIVICVYMGEKLVNIISLEEFLGLCVDYMSVYVRIAEVGCGARVNGDDNIWGK